MEEPKPKPTAYWDGDVQVCRDWDTRKPVPDFTGWCLFAFKGHPYVLFTKILDGERVWSPQEQ